MNDNDLNDKLIKLILAVIEELKRRINKGENFYNKPFKVFVPDLNTLRFKEGKINYYLEIEEIERKDLDFSFEIPEFYKDFCQNLEVFKESAELLKKTYLYTKNEEISILKCLVYDMVYNFFEKVDNREVIIIIKDFLEGLRNISLYIPIRVFIDGIWVKDGRVEISNELTMRKIKSEDFESKSLEVLNNLFNFSGDYPYAILEWKYMLKEEKLNSGDLQQKILGDIGIIIKLLLLFRFGSVFSRKCILPTYILSSSIPLTIVGGFGYSQCKANFEGGEMIHSNPRLQIKSRHNYILSKKDIPDLNEMISIFRNTYMKDILLRSSNNFTFINIALNRYQNAFLNIENYDSQITYAISCLEALFLEEGAELIRKLSQRISLYFKVLGFNPLSINDLVKKAYNIRSKYSHGDISNVKEKEKLARKILQCARISLLTYIQLDPILNDKKIIITLLKDKQLKKKKEKTIKKERKSYFLKILDKALLDDLFYIRIKKFILENSKLCV